MIFNKFKVSQVLMLGVVNVLLLLVVNDQITETLERAYLDFKKQETQNAAYMSKAFIERTIEEGEQLGTPQMELENQVIDYLSKSHFKDLYVWANDDLAVARVHVKPEVIGSFQRSYIRHTKALEGKDIIFETLDNINPVTENIEQKVNAIVFIDKWGWIIGYGSYLYESDISKLKNSIMIWVGLLIVLLDLVSLALIFKLSIRNPKSVL
ncbi:cache domain-containing protein [Marinomonas mediterranea]|jgi:hypothetical protein|uniref:Single Cache domain-containing protein n=1 Tax=Marinomonas mediterranea (strain ATCC 700492 / JCM 21426 / NBRC 103028 / MMB-1) TaxID=717774 RepID=F2K0I0_MARM1|nr:hypothetical protein [Marinomonas mediterranea]ADZ90964.1 hypothetical protein Marme_1708 [Marinomonas mediterranea MMB-1]WCN09001.1 hypothetical protein GV055_08735 [Marinomonas mediterranea]WCN17108.1 hypothetical protein GV053_08645 [Marinomonas mediterranea MMB-1]